MKFVNYCHSQGHLRKHEFFQAVSKLGLCPSDAMILDYDEFQDGGEWDKNQLAAVLLRHIEVVSFVHSK